MTDTAMFSEAIEAIKQRDHDRALDLLMRLLKADKDNPETWLYMSSVVPTTKEQIYCLQNVIRLDPENLAAQRGLILLGKAPAREILSVPQPRRNWAAQIDEDVEELKGFQKIMANPILRILVFLGVGIVAIGLILGGIFGTRGMFKPRLTITPLAWTGTPTETPSETPKVRTPTSTPLFTATPEPLWMLLDATYTPVPLYVDTPHPRLESYRLAMRAYERGDYNGMITFLEQTLRSETASADLEYFLGEAYRLLDDYESALEQYDAAITIDPRFAPAYLARGLLSRSLNPRYDILSELNKAIEYDPRYVDAYLERATYRASNQDFDLALTDLELALEIMPTNPHVYLELAKVHLALGQNETALEFAKTGHELDITLLQGYLIYANALLANGQTKDAQEKLDVYGQYAPNDPMYLALSGAVLYEIGSDYEKAYELLDQARKMDDESAIILFYHGLTAIKLGNANQAVNDFYLARSLEPENFNINIWFGIALYLEGRFDDAYSQIGASEALIVTDEERVMFYYYRGKAALEIGLLSEVEKNWRALQELPDDIVPDSWLYELIIYFATPTYTPTPSQTPTPTASSTITHTPTRTSTFTPTMAKTSTPTPTVTQTPTP